MNIELKEITIQELSNDFQDNAENGVVGFGGNLDIRPPYQREFIYKDKQRDAVINTITKNFPLNVMYW
ncbi:HNH endonuclease, partial [Flavobacterium psychrophilum]|nr:HNH endonuclease [Flavobacterium psychrophilum]